MSNIKTIALHQRQEIVEADDETLASGKPSEMFKCTDHTQSLDNAADITGKGQSNELAHPKESLKHRCSFLIMA